VFSTQAGAKLVGFGLGRVRRAIALRDGQSPRQAAFLASELLAGAPGDPRSDVFGAAALLVFLLTGRPPSRPFAPVAGVPPALTAVLERALAPDPEGRFGTAEEMLRSLEAAGFSVPPDPVRAPAPSLGPPAPAAASQVPSPPSIGEDPPVSLRPLDLTPYRQRLANELTRFDGQVGGPELAKQARSLLALLELLADDLQSVGAPATLIKILRERVRALGSESVATPSWQTVLSDLDKLVKGDALTSPPPRRRWAFWRK